MTISTNRIINVLKHNFVGFNSLLKLIDMEDAEVEAKVALFDLINDGVVTVEDTINGVKLTHVGYTLNHKKRPLVDSPGS